MHPPPSTQPNVHSRQFLHRLLFGGSVRAIVYVAQTHTQPAASLRKVPIPVGHTVFLATPVKNTHMCYDCCCRGRTSVALANITWPFLIQPRAHEVGSKKQATIRSCFHLLSSDSSPANESGVSVSCRQNHAAAALAGASTTTPIYFVPKTRRYKQKQSNKKI